MANREEIFAAIKQHLEGRGIDEDKIAVNADLVRDLDLDSLDTMELTLGMEQHFGIEIPDSDLEQLATVDDAITLIERRLAVNA